MAARKQSGSKSEQIRSLLASGMAPAEIAEQVGCSRNLVYVVKAKQAGGKKTKARQPATAKSESAGHTSRSDDHVENFLASVKELERERDELREVLGKIRRLVNEIT